MLTVDFISYHLSVTHIGITVLAIALEVISNILIERPNPKETRLADQIKIPTVKGIDSADIFTWCIKYKMFNQ